MSAELKLHKTKGTQLTPEEVTERCVAVLDGHIDKGVVTLNHFGKMENAVELANAWFYLKAKLNGELP